MSGPRLAAACLALAMIAAGTAARGADAPDSEPAPPSITPAPAPGAAPAPSLEAGDTSPTTAAPMAQPAFDADARPLVPRNEPFYRKPWFWGGVAGLLLTAAILGSLTLGSSEAPTPETTLGDMHAF